MKKIHGLFFVVLAIFVLIPVLSGCKGGAPSSKSRSASSSPAAASSAVSKPSSDNELAPGLWKMTIRTTVDMPSIAGRPPMNHSTVTTSTECIKPNSSNSKPYPAKPANFDCSNVKEHVDMDGTVHWAMKCKGTRAVFSMKGFSKITPDTFKSHAVGTETSSGAGMSIKSIMDTNGKRLKDKCPSKS